MDKADIKNKLLLFEQELRKVENYHSFQEYTKRISSKLIDFIENEYNFLDLVCTCTVTGSSAILKDKHGNSLQKKSIKKTTGKEKSWGINLYTPPCSFCPFSMPAPRKQCYPLLTGPQNICLGIFHNMEEFPTYEDDVMIGAVSTMTSHHLYIFREYVLPSRNELDKVKADFNRFIHA
ncbi:MAG: hypothetical protein ACOC7U_00725, partial [Spirochaetota bacterium]